MPPTPPYVELHAHSAYSFLDGASQPQELVERALALGHTALALTDHDSVSGAMELATAAKGTPLKPIFGAEITVALPPDTPFRTHASSPGTPFRTHRSSPHTSFRSDRSSPHAPSRNHLTLLVRNREGWANLCRLITLGHSHTRDGPRRQGRDPSPTHASGGQPSVTLQQVIDHSQGLVCLSGCALHGIHHEGTLRKLLQAFGPQSLKIELQRPYARHDRARNRMLEQLARKLSVATIATGDVHAHTHTRALLQDAFVALKHRLVLDSSEGVRRPNHTHVLSRPQAIASRFADHPHAVAETVALAQTLEFDLCHDLGYAYPGAESPHAIQALGEVCHAQLAERYPRGSPNHHQAAARLQQELNTIDRLHLAGFFLLHHQIFQLATLAAKEVRGGDGARSLLAPGRGRGSSVSSIVCYLTGLSHVDPIAAELALGRFLHDEIKTLPDIDLDFPRDVREKLIPLVHKRYGTERSALVAAFPTFRSKGTVRELGKALGLPPGEIERVARTADGWGGRGAVAEAVESAIGERRHSPRWKWLVQLAQEAQGLPRHLSQHSGGIIVATEPLVDCCPIVPAAMQGRQIAQWDKDSCSDAGFLKIDLLGLGMLSAVERCVQLIADRTGELVDLGRIDFHDPQTFQCIQEAETTGVFQIESRAQMGSLRRTKPKTLADLTVQVAIVRPGPIVGGAVNPYIERRQKLNADPNYEIPYLHPSLQGPLQETLGTIVFQDQVIEVAQAFAGLTPGEAESLRRAMSRKRSQEAMERRHDEFVQGALATHADVDVQLAERVWSMVGGFAGFGFPKAHGAAFGLLAYQSTWLRVHHPLEFLCALLNEQPMGFYAPDSLIHEAQRRGVEVLPPDVRESEIHCSIADNGAIRIGLGYVKGLDRRDGVMVVEARGHRPFADLQDLASRAGVSRDALQLLAWAGATDSLAGGGPLARRTALWQLGVATPAHPLAGDVQLTQNVQLSLDMPLPQAPKLRPLSEWDEMLADYATTNVSVQKHPLALLRERLRREGTLSSADLPNAAHRSNVKVAGLVIARQRPSTANGITFLLLEDEHGTVNLIVPSSLYESKRALVRGEPLLLAGGRLERHAAAGGAINVIVSQLEAMPVEDDFKAVAPAVTSFAQGRRR